MINLLPEETKKQLRAAHNNVTSLRYLTFSSIGAGFLAMACIVSFFFIQNTSSTGQTSSSSQSTTSLFNTAKNQLSKLNSDISTARKILDLQINYSDVITEIANALPTGMVLENLTIDNTTVGTPTTLQIDARSADGQELLKANFQSSRSPLFSNFIITSTTPNPNTKSSYTTKFTCTVMIKRGVIQ